MSTPKSDAVVADAARAWGRMRILVLAVKEARNAIDCERETVGTGTGEPDDFSEPPCWKTHEWNYVYEPMDASDWCAPCLRRHRWHLALVAIKRIHGGRLRRLQRLSASPPSVDAVDPQVGSTGTPTTREKGISDRGVSPQTPEPRR